MDKTIASLLAMVSHLAHGLMIIARVVVALMVVLITSDVILRYFFNSPIAGSYELIEFMMVFVVFLGLAYTQVRKGHLCISLFTKNLSAPTMAVLNSLSYLLCLSIFVLISWRLSVTASSEFSNGSVSTVLNIPIWISYWVTVAGSITLTIVFLTDFMQSVQYVIQ